MKTIFALLWFICLPAFALTPGQVYLQRFMSYLDWSQNLPEEPGESFQTFIDSNTPLAKKLRDKWLYKLALKKDWFNYSKQYKPSLDTSLQCYDLLASYYQGDTSALAKAKSLWLTGDSRPPACNQLFTLMLHDKDFDENLITQRLVLALDKRNLPLAQYLLKQYKIPRLKDEQVLMNIHRTPARIVQLNPGPLQGVFYLYGLKRMVSINLDQAINLWQNNKTRKILSKAEQQSFLAHVALYKAMRNSPDAKTWFAKVEPGYYNDVLLEWQIRFALKSQNWKQVTKLIALHAEKDKPCWQYWLARSLDAQGKKEDAKAIYISLAQTRHYYGFLASLRLNQKPHFQNENVVSDMRVLKYYQPLTDNIKSLYRSRQILQASRLLNDFASELPKEDRSALVYWVSNHLQWHGKSVFLSNNDELNNQLSLRFPLAYHSTINEHSKKYQIPSELVYAIIRQESGFRDDVVSSAGARGLMQVMPATASVVAKSAKIPYGDKAQLFVSQKNINIGVAYLGTLSKRFGKNPLLMVAAYNAGPRQVNYWLKNHPPKEIDIWIETLPWHETRNYLKNIISFYAVYQYRMHKNTDLGDFMKPI